MLEEEFHRESLSKGKISVHIDRAIVESSDYVFNIVLGSCVSVVLCGIDPGSRVWLGANHLFKSRNENTDVSLKHIADLLDMLEKKNAGQISCLGVFGAGYRKDSIVKSVATRNVLTVLEALSIFGLTIELFQTGYSQGLSILKSDSRDSFMVKQYNISSRETKITEIPLSTVFRARKN